MIVDTEASIRFLRTAYEPDDWIAVFLKSYETGQTLQRVGPLSLFLEPRVHAWLRAMNAKRFNVYVSVNAIREGQRTRTKDAIAAVRHIFLEADEDGAERPGDDRGRARTCRRRRTSWNHRRAGCTSSGASAGFTTEGAERLQKHLAREFGTDPAATSCSQTTRMPGTRTTRRPSHLITFEYGADRSAAHPAGLPCALCSPVIPAGHSAARTSSMSVVERARRYLARIEPAIAGQHGDLHTFKVCCRIVRGFALSDEEAIAALTDWNARCAPPWSEHELRDKIARARRYGRERSAASRNGFNVIALP